MNEKGLSLGMLWYPETEFPAVNESDISKALEILDSPSWILGNFATVDEVKAALQGVTIWGAKNSKLGGIPPLHIALHDASGKSLVIEFNDGQINVYDNPIGVLTNSPNFAWQITNLRNYANLTVMDIAPIKVNGYTVYPTGHGAGLHGLPGDSTPPSRFVRTVINAQMSITAADAASAVNLAQHILNTVDIPKGIDRLNSKTTMGDHTQWAVMKDLKNRIYYYRSYYDLSLKIIDLKKIDFSAGSPLHSISIIGTSQPADDVTSMMK
jgi:choloylglycine hydrolase